MPYEHRLNIREGSHCVLSHLRIARRFKHRRYPTSTHSHEARLSPISHSCPNATARLKPQAVTAVQRALLRALMTGMVMNVAVSVVVVAAIARTTKH